MTQTQQPLLSITSPASLRQFTGSMLESDELLQSMVTVFQEICEVNYCLLLLLEEEEVRQVYSTVQSKSNLQKQSLINFSWDIYRQNQIYLEPGKIFSLVIQNSLIPLKAKKKAQQLRIQSVGLIPLQYQQSLVGVLCLHSGQNKLKGLEKKLELIRHLIFQTTLLIQQNRKTIQEKCYQKLIKLLNQQLNYHYLTPIILENILQQIATSFKVEQIVLIKIPSLQALCDLPPQCGENSQTQKQPLQPGQIHHLFSNRSERESTPLNLDQLSLQNLCETQQIHYFPDSPKINCNSKSFLESSILSLPVMVKGEFFGTLILQTQQYRQFTEDEIQILEQIGEQIGVAIYQISLQEQLNAKQETHQHTSEYFSNMTHELRAPLAGILGFARMLQEQIYGTLNPKQSQYVNAVVSSGEHLMAIVNDLLDLSKIEANREELFLEKLVVEEICLAALSIVQARAEQQGLTIELDIAKDVDFCFGDQQRLKQILINLLSNAIKFTERGSVTLKVERQHKSITFSVNDTGIGIAPADQTKLFQPFQQVKNSLSRKHKGTGLGLTLSRKLARLHGGDITLTSEVGKGSCFTVKIPHLEEPSKAQGTSF